MSKLELCNNKPDMEILFFMETFSFHWKKNGYVQKHPNKPP